MLRSTFIWKLNARLCTWKYISVTHVWETLILEQIFNFWFDYQSNVRVLCTIQWIMNHSRRLVCRPVVHMNNKFAKWLSVVATSAINYFYDLPECDEIIDKSRTSATSEKILAQTKLELRIKISHVSFDICLLRCTRETSHFSESISR